MPRQSATGGPERPVLTAWGRANLRWIFLHPRFRAIPAIPCDHGGFLEFLGRDSLRAHILPQRFWHYHASVRLLIVLEDCQPRAPDRQAAAIERMYELR